MNRYHILTAIQALESVRKDIVSEFNEKNNAEGPKTTSCIVSVENLKRRSDDLSDAISAFSLLLARRPVGDISLTVDPAPPSESTPHFSPEIIEEMRSALRNNVMASDSAVKLMQRIADGCAISPGWLQSLRNLQKRRDIARLAAKVFDAAYPEKEEKQ